MEKKEKKIISLLVEDEFGALSRIVELFGSRGFNLHSICTGESREEGIQRMTLVCYESDKNIQQIIKVLKNIIYIYEAKLIELENSIHRELILVKVKLEKKNQTELLATIQALPASICITSKDWLCFQFYGEEPQINQMVKHFKSRYKIIEISRTGEAALDCNLQKSSKIRKP